MKTCKKCGLTEEHVKFRKVRHVCTPCEYKMFTEANNKRREDPDYAAKQDAKKAEYRKTDACKESQRKTNLRPERIAAQNKRSKERTFEYQKHYSLKNRYGIGLEDYIAMLDSQEGKCKICGVNNNADGRMLFVDHDHDTGKIRGLLCHKCNAAIGLMNNDPELLHKAITYLKENIT